MRMRKVGIEMEHHDQYTEHPIPQTPDLDCTPSGLQDMAAALNAILTQLKNEAIDANTYTTIVESPHEMIKSDLQSSHDTTVHKTTILSGDNTQEPFAPMRKNCHGSMYPDAVDHTISAGIQAVGDVDHSKVGLSAGHSLSMELKPKEGRKGKKNKKDKKGMKGKMGKKIKNSEQQTCNSDEGAAPPTLMGRPQEEGVEMDRVIQQGAVCEPGGGCFVLPCIACCYDWVIQFTSGIIPSMFLQGALRNAAGASICPKCETVPIATRTIMDSNFREFQVIPMSPSLLYRMDAMEKIESFVGEYVPVMAFNNEILFIQGGEIMEMVKHGGRLVKTDT